MIEASAASFDPADPALPTDRIQVLMGRCPSGLTLVTQHGGSPLAQAIPEVATGLWTNADEYHAAVEIYTDSGGK